MSERRPPYCATNTDLACPACKAVASVCVREKDSYFDGDCCEAYCNECHANLEVQVAVDVEFCCPEVAT